MDVSVRTRLLLLVLVVTPLVSAGMNQPGSMLVFPAETCTVHSDLDAETAQSFAAHLDTTFESYRNLFRSFTLPATLNLNAYIFSREQDYLEFVAEEFKVDGNGSWGMFIERGSEKALVAWMGDRDPLEMRHVLQHEGFHLFAAELFPGIPVWINEGFAELFGHAVEVDGSLVVGEVPLGSLRRLQLARQADALVLFDSFFEIDPATWGAHVQQGQASLNYLQAWALVHFFLYAEDGRWQQQFLQFLEQLNRGMEWRSAFRTTFQVESWSQIQGAFLSYLDSIHPSDYALVIQRLEFLAAGMQFLNSHGIYPSTMQLLRQQLQLKDFSYTSHLFGATRQLQAADEDLYRLPGTDGSKDMPHLSMADDQGKPILGVNRKARRPWNIRTVGLVPRNFMVRWIRHGDGWRFELAYQ